MASIVSTRDVPTPVSDDWQSVLCGAVRCRIELCRLLDLDVSSVGSEAAAETFPLQVPRPYLARIRPGDPQDPLLLQVLPQAAETDDVSGYGPDPLGEADALACPGLLSKYSGRSLIVTTGRCAVHCRFCFRRHFRAENDVSQPGWQAAVEQIRSTPSVREAILSGGEPLTLADDQLAQLLEELGAIRHLRRVRIHSRMPVAIPQRIDDRLIGLLQQSRLPVILVVHVNHPAEIDRAVADALGRLVDAGIPVLSQSVLLREVNDRLETLAELFERLVDLRVMPYYLHQLDRVEGAAHFEVGESDGVRLVAQLRTQLPGYAVPRYVRETPGEAAKEVLA